MTFAQASAAATFKRLLRTIKNQLLSMSVWSMRYSCNSVVAGVAGDGVDRWATDADLVWTNAGAVCSWMVLRNSGMGATFEVCIGCKSSIFTVWEAGITVRCSSIGFSGGDTSTLPSAADQVTIANGAYGNSQPTWGPSGRWADNNANGGGPGNFTASTHAIVSTDGQVSHVWVTSGWDGQAHWMFMKPRAPIAAWTDPWLASVKGAYGNTVLIGDTRCKSEPTNPSVYTYINGVAATALLSYEGLPVSGRGGGVLGVTGWNDITQSWELFPMGVWVTAAGARGRQGRVWDYWYCSDSLHTGNSFPSDGTRKLMAFTHSVVPWNGATARFG
jgi:hypothetical protein